MVINSVDIKDYSHFVEETRRLDSFLDCKTYIMHGTLESVYGSFDHSYENTRQDISDFIVNNIENETIESYNDFSNTEDSKKSIFPAFCGAIKLYHSIREKGILDPICINHYKEYTWIHPGATRYFFKEAFSDDISAIVTDYSGDIKVKYPDLELFDLEDCEIDISKTEKVLRVVGFQQQQIDVFNLHSIDLDYFKEFIHNDSLEKLYSHTKFYPNITYKNGLISSKGIDILKKENGKWSAIPVR